MRIKRSIFLILIFVSVSIFSAGSIYVLENDFKVASTTNDFLSNDAIEVKIHYKGNEKIELGKIGEGENYIILKEEIGLYNMDAIYFKGELHNKFNVIRGRFFNENDFCNDKKSAIVGIDRLDEVVNINGEEILIFQGEFFNVIGVIGDEVKETVENDYIYVNLDSLMDIDSISGNYIIDGKNKSREIVNNIKEGINDIQIHDIIRTNEPNKYIKEYVKDSVLFILLVVGTLILSTSIVTEFWIKDRKKEIGIKRALGATKLNISLHIILELLSISTISFIIGYLLYLLVTFIIDGYFHFYLLTTIIVFALTIVSALIVSIVPIAKMNKMEPKDIMR